MSSAEPCVQSVSCSVKRNLVYEPDATGTGLAAAVDAFFAGETPGSPVATLTPVAACVAAPILLTAVLGFVVCFATAAAADDFAVVPMAAGFTPKPFAAGPVSACSRATGSASEEASSSRHGAPSGMPIAGRSACMPMYDGLTTG